MSFHLVSNKPGDVLTASEDDVEHFTLQHVRSASDVAVIGDLEWQVTNPCFGEGEKIHHSRFLGFLWTPKNLFAKARCAGTWI